MIRAIVVDDEKPSREVLCNYLKEYCDDIEIAGTASSIKNAYKAIKKLNPDLVFLDIELGDGKGFDLLKKFKRIDFQIVFVTAYAEYAIKAFRVNAIDYLLKPIKIDELKTAVEKVRKSNNQLPDQEKILAIIKMLSESSDLQPTILISHMKGFDVLKVCEIIMCKADGYCTNIHLTGKRKIVSSKNLKHFEEILDKHKFIRVHHSFLINLNHVCSYTKQGEIELTEGNKAFLADSNRKMVLGLLSNHF